MTINLIGTISSHIPVLFSGPLSYFQIYIDQPRLCFISSDKILNENVSNEETYEELARDLVISAMEGINGTSSC